MKQVVQIGVGQTAKVLAILYFIMTAIFCVIFAPFVLLSGPAEHPVMPFGGALLGVVLIAAPFLYAIVAYIGAALVSAIYNFVARRFGGVEFELTERGTGS
ncbi:MAG TPA: hypothetical protein VGS98_07320 [Thermoanaerobaculia bacterium]|jgi:hypothetical protein|nr:hypothetical protein [Thermoanaerobaculia bacterium]